MLKIEFQKYIESNKLFSHTDKLLVAVSGGIDSVALLHLLVINGYECAVINCNFQLRGVESDEDQAFVVSMASNYSIPVYSNRFNTGEYANLHGISIQMAARDLRYKWFEEVRTKFGYDYIAVAHQRNDVVETFHINLTRGTGIKGLCGIKSKNQTVVRPLLFASRKEIEQYVKVNNLHYREDSSNASTKYSRNKIRHLIIPTFEKINPQYQKTIFDCSVKLREIEEIYRETVETKRAEIVSQNQGKIYIDINKLLKLQQISTYLYEFLTPYSFNSAQIEQIFQSLYDIPGKQFISHKYCLLRDRDYLIISNIDSNEDSETEFFLSLETINDDEQVVKQIGDKRMIFNVFYREYDFEINSSPKVAQLDWDKLETLLTIRVWQEGDFFFPLGMNGKKKVSDFLIDSKVPLNEKQNIWSVFSGGNLVWLVENRIDNRYKISADTKKILQIEIK